MFNQLVFFSVQYLYIVIAVIAIVFLVSKLYADRKPILILALLSSIVALVIDKALNAIVYSPRPFVVENISPLVPHVADNGFPSEHTLFAILIAGIIFILHKKMGILLGTLAMIVGIGSVLAKVHHPIDVLGSVVIAIVSILVSSYIISRFQNKKLSTFCFDNTP